MPGKYSQVYDIEINSPSCEPGVCRTNCRKNVNCFSQLGEKFWFNDIKESYWVNFTDSESERRLKGNHVGLKNLGATCYVNTFLQLSFHNKAFRYAIYQWKSTGGYAPKLTIKDNGEGAPKSLLLEFNANQTNKICGNLQYLFALLELSIRRYVDPSSFVECLGLQTNEQQDAQEFNKLFTTLLSNAFSSQDSFLSNTIDSQFGGQYKYETKCCVCQSTSVTYSKFYELDLNVKGHSSLSGCLKEFLQEELMQDENQYFCSICHCKQDAIRKIVLEKLPPILKLQLLRFVFERETGMKKKINTALNFPEILDLGKYIKFDNPDDGIYHLSSVLIHRGLSAHSGHYIAHIHDKENNIWCRFNDEDVTVMKGKSLQLGMEDDLEDFAETKCKKPRKCEQDTVTHSSKNAYMLVYSKISNSNPSHTVCEVPVFMKEAVEKDNSLFDVWATERSNSRKIAINAGLEKKKAVQSIFKRLPVQEGECFEWVSVKWLKEWLNPENKLVPPIDNKELMCCHDLADPTKLNLMKRISSEAAELLFTQYGGLPRLKLICSQCLEIEKRRKEFEEQLNQDMKVFANSLKTSYKTNSQKAYWVGKKSLKKIKSLARQEFFKYKPLFKEVTAEINMEIKEKTLEETTSILPKKKLTFFNEDCLCLFHGNLCMSEDARKLVSEEVWLKCKKYFPQAPEFLSNARACDICTINKNTHREESATLKLLAAEQKQALSFLLEDPNKRMQFFLQQDGVFHIILHSFIEAWKKSFRGTRRALLTNVDNSDVICKHGLTLYQAEELIDEACKSDPQVFMISSNEHSLILNFFTFSHDISIKISQYDHSDTKIFAITPDYCVECRNTRLAEEMFDSQQYTSAPIYVTRQVVSDTSSQAKVLRTNTKDILCNSECKVIISPIDESLLNSNKLLKKCLKKIPNDDNRRSARRRMQFGEHLFRVDSNNTLKQLKIQLMQHFSVLPMEQTLISADGMLLEDDNKSLIELGIKSGAHLVLEVQEPNPETVVLQESVKTRSLEEGFKGTSLLSGF